MIFLIFWGKFEGFSDIRIRLSLQKAYLRRVVITFERSQHSSSESFKNFTNFTLKLMENFIINFPSHLKSF